MLKRIRVCYPYKRNLDLKFGVNPSWNKWPRFLKYSSLFLVKTKKKSTIWSKDLGASLGKSMFWPIKGKYEVMWAPRSHKIEEFNLQNWSPNHAKSGCYWWLERWTTKQVMIRQSKLSLPLMLDNILFDDLPNDYSRGWLIVTWSSPS